MIVVSESHKENIPKSTQIGWSEFFSAPDEVLLLTAYRDKAFFYPPSTVPILINSRNAKRPLTQNLQYHMTQEGGEAINRIFGMLPYNPKTPLIRWFSKNGKTKEGIECVNEISDYYPGMVTLDKYIANEQVRNSMNCSSGKLALRSMFDQVFNAVGAIHNLGYLHRDIKPSNIGVLPYRVVSIDSNRIDIQNFDYDPFNVCIKLFDYETVVPKFSKRFLALRGRTDRYASPEAIPENVKKLWDYIEMMMISKVM